MNSRKIDLLAQNYLAEATTFDQAGNAVEALKYLNKAIALRPTRSMLATAHLARGLVNMELGLAEPTVKDFIEVLQLSNDPIERDIARLRLGLKEQGEAH